MKKKIILISGDPNSINSEIIYKSWKKLNLATRKKIYLVSNYTLLKKQFKKLKYSIGITKVKNINIRSDTKNLKIIDISLKFSNPFKVNFKNASEFVKKSLNNAHKLALRDDVSGIINCPINKNLLKKNNIGVTEYLASKCKIRNNNETMLIFNKKLSVCPITTHLDIKKVAKRISKKIIINKTITIQRWFKKIFSKKPKIAILGLNPHNAELKKYSEERKIIIPAILKLNRFGLNVKGPMIADTFFINDYKKFDIIIGMYHDQVLVPFKTLFKFDGINITLGLKYLRASPDHGVATNLIGKKKANPHSLLECINFLNKFGK